MTGRMVEGALVADGDRCPGCGESRMDYLVWLVNPYSEDPRDIVNCATCGAVYDPMEEDGMTTDFREITE